MQTLGQAGAAVDEAVARFGRIDVLVNNAGNSYLGNFEELTNADIERQMATNFYGVVNVLRAALPVLRKQRGGHIINVSSTAGAAGFKHCTAYSASKFAVEGLTLSLALEVEQFGIKLTIVEPGFFRTNLLAAQNVSYAKSSIADYAHEGSAEAMWSGYDGKQPNDPEKLGEALVKLSNMLAPPRFFAAGPDALGAVRPVMEARLKDMQEHEDLSNCDGRQRRAPSTRTRAVPDCALGSRCSGTYSAFHPSRTAPRETQPAVDCMTRSRAGPVPGPRLSRRFTYGSMRVQPSLSAAGRATTSGT